MLKNRYEYPPGGFQFVQPETGWSAPPGSFDVVVRAIIAHRKANLALAQKHSWSLDYDIVANELDAYNDLRCRNSGWANFITETFSGGPTVPFWPAFHSPLKSRLAAAVASVKKVTAGVRTLLDWVGSGGRPVERELAEFRAAICAGCPQNGNGDWTRFFTAPAANEIRLQLEIKNQMKLETSQDSKLSVCEVCLCPLKLKVWAPMEHTLKEMTGETKGKLDSRCWILKA